MNLRWIARLVLFAILVPTSIVEWKHYSKPHTIGSRVYLPHVCTKAEEDNRGDGEEEWIRLYPNKAYINDAAVPRDQIVDAVGTLMDTRAERVVYLIADQQLTYGEVASWVMQMQAKSPNLVVLLITHSQDEASRELHCVRLPMLRVEDMYSPSHLPQTH